MADPKHDAAGQQVLPVDLTHVGSTPQTGRDIAADLANLDIALSALRDAIEGSGDKNFTTLDTLLATALARNITKWGGTTLTGRDISPDLAVLTDLKKGALNADDLTAETANVLKAIGHLYGFDGTTWDRIRAALTSDSINLHSLTGLVTASVLHGRQDGATVSPLDARQPADAQNLGALINLCTIAEQMRYNGGTWDRARNNAEVSILASAARAADADSADQVNYNHRGVVLFFNISAIVGDDTCKIVVKGRDSGSGTDYELFTSAELGTTGFRVYEIHPEAAAASGGVTAVAARILPRNWKVTFDYTQVTGVADSITASVTASYVP